MRTGAALRRGVGAAPLSRALRPYGNAVVYVFFAGHGVADDEGRAYLMPFEARKDSPFSTGGIRANQFLKDLEESINARHLVLFIDACHAGAVVSVDGTARGGPNVSKEFLQTWNQSFNNAQGIHMGMLSAGSNQLSYEDHEFKRGLFTHFLLLGLKGKADSNPKDGRIDAGELYRYVLDKVDKASGAKFGARQTPVISQKFDPSLTPAMTPPIKALNPQLSYVKFFEQGAGDAPTRGQRQYIQPELRRSARYANWELGVKIPAPGAEVKVKIEAVWNRPDGTIYKEAINSAIQDNWADVYFTGSGYGYKEPGNWSQGSYKVDFFLDGEKFASESFKVPGSNSQATIPDIPFPLNLEIPLLNLDLSGAGTFWALNPKLSFVKFFEQGKGEIPPPAQAGRRATGC